MAREASYSQWLQRRSVSVPQVRVHGFTVCTEQYWDVLDCYPVVRSRGGHGMWSYRHEQIERISLTFFVHPRISRGHEQDHRRYVTKAR